MGVSEDTPNDQEMPAPAFFEDILQLGRQCLLKTMGRHFLVQIVAVDERTIRVSFPGRGYPVEGTPANLEFHDEKGYFFYSTQVVEGPSSRTIGVLLERPQDLRRSIHRNAYRVPTELTILVREQNYANSYEAWLINLSVTGALIQTEAPFDHRTTINLTFNLPGEAELTVEGLIVHVADAPLWRRFPPFVFGIRFYEVDEQDENTLSRYIWMRLQELSPQE